MPAHASGAAEGGGTALISVMIGAALLLLLTAALMYRRQLQQISLRTRELQRSEKRFRVLVEGTNVVAWEYDAGSDAFTYVSAPGEHLLGFSLDDWRRSGFWRSRLHPEDRELALAFLRDTMAYADAREGEYRLLLVACGWARDPCARSAQSHGKASGASQRAAWHLCGYHCTQGLGSGIGG
ncbi:PAS domain-containing protein [Candidatus Dactylopiibacterium carminicum]|uniref:PAS domain-containing protein n=1 Tax=Candidatus Dactylopiibacterium carminicum TaxID=857335 RepID=UPI00114110D4|nr:PAS domain-containing protein [Candidatus Dactylopiibacterium carminicum]